LPSEATACYADHHSVFLKTIGFAFYFCSPADTIGFILRGPVLSTPGFALASWLLNLDSLPDL